MRARTGMTGISALTGITGSDEGSPPPPPDTEPPTNPTDLTGNIDESGLVLSWTESTDNVGVDHYDVEQNNGIDESWILLGSSGTNSYIVASPIASYKFRVYAVDAANNASGYSNEFVYA